MRLVTNHRFDEITAYQLGWSVFITPLMTVYCYIFDDIMIDTGQSRMRKEILQIAARHHINRIFLTHHHEDHSGNASAIKQAFHSTVYGHPDTVRKMAGPFNILPYQSYMWGKASPLTVEIVPRTVDTDHGQMIPIHTPGHSEDHLAYFLKNEGILFSGDFFLSDRIKYFRSDENIGMQITSLKKILGLDFDMLLCSHHPKQKDGKKHLKRKLAFLEDLYGNIILLWEKGLSENQIFRALNLKENHFIKYFCFGDVSMINGVRSVIRNYKN